MLIDRISARVVLELTFPPAASDTVLTVKTLQTLGNIGLQS